MGRAPCCDKANVKKGPWSPEEDTKLKSYIEQHGTGGNWIALPHKIGLKRCGKSCRLRWLNYLRPNIKHGDFSEEEDNIICSLYATIGSRWSIIASQLPGRTDNDIKNYWNTRLRKKLLAKNRKEQNTQSRPKLLMKNQTENLVTPMTQNSTWPNQQYHDLNHGRNLANKVEGTSYSQSLSHHTINSDYQLVQLEHQLYSASINSATVPPMVNNSSISSYESSNILEGFESFSDDSYWSELLATSMRPQQQQQQERDESTSWSDITSQLHGYSTLLSGYEGMPHHDIACLENSTYFGVQ